MFNPDELTDQERSEYVKRAFHFLAGDDAKISAREFAVLFTQGKNYNQEESNACHCSTPGCMRQPWNGVPGQACCQTCIVNDGRFHGDVCNSRFHAKDIIEQLF